MIEWAGLGVAMGNASEKVKSSADLVIKPASEQGLALLLETLLSEGHFASFTLSLDGPQMLQVRLLRTTRRERARAVGSLRRVRVIPLEAEPLALSLVEV